MKNVEIEYLNDNSYFALLTTLSPNNPIDLIRQFVEEHQFNCLGNIIVDCILYTGNNSDRFIEIKCEDGKLNLNKYNFVILDRKNEIRIKANNTLRRYPVLVNNSILSNSQKKLLLHGISI